MTRRGRTALALCATLGVTSMGVAATPGLLTGDCECWEVTGNSGFSYPFTIIVTASLIDDDTGDVASMSAAQTSLPAGGGAWAVSNCWPDDVPAGNYRIEALEQVRNDDVGQIWLSFDLEFPEDGTTFECVSANEGCTLGYWKQPHHSGDWVAYLPGQGFSTVFDDAFPGLSLDDVLHLTGSSPPGPNQLNTLGKHTVAALLNASGDVSFPLTTAEVIAQFNAAYASGAYEAQKDLFEALNEAGCPLNGNADLTLDGLVNIEDLLVVFAYWGTDEQRADPNEDGTVGIGDLLHVFKWWGS